MTIAALTPRVLLMAVCDDVTPSDTESDVFHLQGVRHSAYGGDPTIEMPLHVFLLLSCHRAGRYTGKVLLVQEDSERTLRYFKFEVAFQDDVPLVPCFYDLGLCLFPGSGRYWFQIWFADHNTHEVQKAEHPFYILPNKE